MSAQPRVRKVILSTGNILEMEDLIRKAGQTTNEELRGSIKKTLNNWEGRKAEAQNGDVLTIQRSLNNVPPKENSGTKTTVKLFLSNTDSSQVEDAIKTVTTGLDLPHIDSVIVTPPDVSDDATLESLEPMWQALEDAVNRGVVTGIGLADVSTRLFTELYEWAKVKPTTMQVNLSSCCIVPQELSTFAQQHDIQVLTHNDPAEIVDEEVVSTITSCLGLSTGQCQIQWIARHRTIQQCFGLIQDKGYTLALACDG
ncbi:glutamate--cysteine ligase regulatory subunit-like [Homarus americanus]|uniref:Glutamate--cysteine ligase regulatory subunit-like n=1 Tax=Homarus americanus TaxID=6706 RepID=A0A8J5T4I5_HOMAM|nr:glutamate--cysteine ligase regulatory subunit-like [Homarus americanus]KAG7172546.1 Glutamate--cysteine ligase regulatory subunit-like [Homarus americanus]